MAVLSSIKRTLAYFDQFSYPLTAEELYHWLWQPPPGVGWGNFLVTLEAAVAKRDCVSTASYYMLPGRESLAMERQRCLLLVESKLALARRAAKILSAVPFVRGIFVCNTVAAGWPTAESDIDVLVVARNGRLWLARLLVTIAASLINVRRGKKYIADKVCLSFYLTDSHLNLDSVRIAEPDIYLTYWLRQLMPVFDPDNILKQLHEANKWTKQYIPHGVTYTKFHPHLFVPCPKIRHVAKNILEKMLKGKLGGVLESLVRRLQKERIAKQAHNIPPAVVISDEMLKFHEDDRRVAYQTAWRNRL